MNILLIGKHRYPKDIFSNKLDMKTWRSMAAYFDRLFVVAESPDLFFHFGKENNIWIYLMPHLGYVGFVFFSVIFGLYIKLRFGIDVFDASEVAGGGIAATFLKFLSGVPSVVEIQGEIFRKVEKRESFKSWLLKKIGRFVIKRANRIRVISHAIFSQVREQGISENKIRLVSLRVDLNLFNPIRFGKSIRQTLYFGDKAVDNYVVIGYLGRLVNGKGLEDFLVAISNLKYPACAEASVSRQISKFKVLIFGSGSLETKFKKMAKDLKIENKIEWRGFVPYSKVPEALSQIDIFVYPSWHEGFGRSIMEALVMEKAVVATRVGGILDLIKDGENGFLVEPHNPHQLAEKIKILIDNKELRDKFGKSGREWVSKNFEWNDGIKKFANLFLELK